jgi:hypothetical protein
MTVFAEVSRCGLGSPTEFQCLETLQLELIVFSAFGGLACIMLVAYTNLFINSQFPNKKIPQASWSTKHKLVYSMWKVLYVYHYNLLGSTSYDVFLRVAGFLVLVYQLQRMFEEPRAYSKMINWMELTFFTFVLVINFCIILEDLTSEYILYQHLPIMAVACLFMSMILITTKGRKNRLVTSRDSRQLTLFPHE